MSTAYDPLTPEEVSDAAKEFFPLFDIVHRSMPENCTVEDTIKVMETVCQMAQKRRAYDKGEVGHHLVLTKNQRRLKLKRQLMRDPNLGMNEDINT